MGKIRILNDEIINQIAAGEIIEAPHSALKEIVENSIDACAKNIDIFLKNGGKSKIVVEDDGDGIQSEKDLKSCILRHATSKLQGNNLFDINSYGFRGEALPSIASISNFSIESNGRGISVDFSEVSDIYPSNISHGTRVCASNIFDKLPVRLKFLKSDNSELAKCIDVIENFALTKDNVNFTLRTDGKYMVSYKDDSIESRISKIYGANLFEKTIYFEEKEDDISVKGYLFHPSHSKYASTNATRLFVNNRVVKNKTVNIALKIGYRNVIEGNRYPMAIVYIDIDPLMVDINISPTKSEVRFRDEQTVQKFLIRAVTKNISQFNKVALDFNIENFNVENVEKPIVQAVPQYSRPEYPRRTPYITEAMIERIQITPLPCSTPSEAKPIIIQPEKEPFCGKAVAQVFDTYIISYKHETEEIFIIDQHAVHEKITMNKMLNDINNNENVQYLMRPEIINISDTQTLRINKIMETLTGFGFKIDIVASSSTTETTDGSVALDISSKNLLIIKAIPGCLHNDEASQLISDIISDTEEITDKTEYIRKRIADTACHNSIRGGRKLSIEEMNNMIRDMDNNDDIFQCNHHRPSFLKLSKKDFEKMFERS